MDTVTPNGSCDGLTYDPTTANLIPSNKAVGIATYEQQQPPPPGPNITTTTTTTTQLEDDDNPTYRAMQTCCRPNSEVRKLDSDCVLWCELTTSTTTTTGGADSNNNNSNSSLLELFEDCMLGIPDRGEGVVRTVNGTGDVKTGGAGPGGRLSLVGVGIVAVLMVGGLVGLG
ncbi:hypothetical protein F4778DRAFT_778252 [Xylariomycetidae sp. FL2044]|nr:hypothetical protein F4778DRAFT_778252 [Xylariomycetidae sp. FL2044]